MDEENNSINNNKIDIENNPLSEITKSNKIDGNQIKISEKIIEIDLPEVKKEELSLVEYNIFLQLKELFVIVILKFGKNV